MVVVDFILSISVAIHILFSVNALQEFKYIDGFIIVGACHRICLKWQRKKLRLLYIYYCLAQNTIPK